MWYLVSFLGGALGFAVWDRKSKNTGLNLTAAIAQGAIIYYLLKKIK